MTAESPKDPDPAAGGEEKPQNQEARRILIASCSIAIVSVLIFIGTYSRSQNEYVPCDLKAIGAYTNEPAGTPIVPNGAGKALDGRMVESVGRYADGVLKVGSATAGGVKCNFDRHLENTGILYVRGIFHVAKNIPAAGTEFPYSIDVTETREDEFPEDDLVTFRMGACRVAGLTAVTAMFVGLVTTIRLVAPVRKAQKCGVCGCDLRGARGQYCPKCGALR